MFQDTAEKEEAERRSLESMIKELQIRLEEAETTALKNGRKIIEKLEAKLMHLNSELDTERQFKADLSKNYKKAERKFREMEFQFEEERKNSTRLRVIKDHFS